MMVTCVYCSKNFQTTIEGKCPFCEKPYPQWLRKCPECAHIFIMSPHTKTKAHDCPNCGVHLHLPKGKGKSHVTFLAADRDTCEKLVKLLEDTISQQYGGVEFTFDYHGEREKELKFAYSLLDRSKTFLRKQEFRYGLNPHEFIISVMETMLADPWWKANIKSYQMTVNGVSKVALEVFGKKKQAWLQNKAQEASYINYTVLSPEWN